MHTKTKATGGGPIVFILVHIIGIFGPFFVGIDSRAVMACFISYYLRMFFVTGFAHRYFSHRTFDPLGPKWWRTFVIYSMGTAFMTTAQKSFLWWAALHRHHHAHSDTDEDIHSRRGFKSFWRGFYWQHLGWILSEKYDEYDRTKVRDHLNPHPGLAWFDTGWGMILPPVAYATCIFLIGASMGISVKMLVWGFFTSTVLLYHGTFCINSMAHLHGKQRYTTGDDSKNSWILAIITMGEGWHNNHHKHQHRLAQGETRFEKMFDWTYLIIKFAEKCGLVRCR